MDMWGRTGRTVIDYDKLANRDISYEELATASDPELLNYSRWLIT